MFDFISGLESFLTRVSGVTNNVSMFKFYKKKNHKDGDYICYPNNCQRDILLTPEMMETKCLEVAPSLKDYITFKESPHGISIFFDRTLCFKSGLLETALLKDQYGYSKLFEGKVFKFSVETKKNPDSLTYMRLILVKEILHNLLEASGGSLDKNDQILESRYIRVTTKNDHKDTSINVLVGSVITMDGSMENLNVEGYKRLRMDEIDAMCEHKLDVNEGINNKDELIRTTMLFDLLQSNISRSLTLRLTDEDVNRRTSCKGSLFVMYNYVRLFALCSKFEEEVENGRYPPLPAFSQIDFLLLSDKEWALLVDFVLCWPSVIEKSLMDLYSGRPKIHLIFNFLSSLALQYSQYYHRTRILTEPRSHLLPILYARIYLLRSVMQIFLNGFKILNITPLVKM